MSEHAATVRWERTTDSFAYTDYNREHLWQTEGAPDIHASAAPEFLGRPDHIDPEQALVASISSCHMLTFLAICARKRIVVDSYVDRAKGYMERNEQGALAVTRVVLAPQIRFDGEAPDDATLDRIHHQSHQDCFIANSVRTEITMARMS
jgi:organic hydroperoxide reductase OsmC/OhrA